VKVANDGLTLWYGTPDALAPPADGAARRGLSVTVAARPPSPDNAVRIYYRVDRGIVRMLAARDLGTDYASQVQYFRADFPPFLDGQIVEYGSVLSCAGRQAPAASYGSLLPSRFRLADPTDAEGAPPEQPAEEPFGRSPRFVPRLEFVASVITKISSQSDTIGPTPDGLRINYYLAGGDVRGPRLNGKDLPRGGDMLTIRQDGIAIIDVRCVYLMSDGAAIGADISGCIDLGPDGYERALGGDFPAVASLQLAPTLIAADSRYLWLNRCQFTGVGEVRVTTSIVTYDLFAVHNDVPSGV
jgi:Protein of unknown function (DUF3237)